YGTHDGLPRADRLAEVALDGEGRPPQVLQGNGILEPVLLTDRLETGGVRVGASHDPGRIAGDHAHAREDDHADHAEGHYRDESPLDQELEHGRPWLGDQFQDAPLIRIRPSGTA